MTLLTDTRVAALKPPEKGQVEYPDHKVTGLRLRIGAGGTKTWTLRKRVGSKTVNRKIGVYPAVKLAGARIAAERMLEALERDGGTESLDRTFGQLAAHWLEKHAQIENRGWRDQERQLELHVYPTWQDMKLSDLRKGDVRALLEGLEGKVLPNRILALVKAILAYGAANDWIEASPAAPIKKPRSETRRDRVLDMGEVARLWSAAELLGYPLGPWTRVLLLTGQRRSEVAEMRWSDIDLEAGDWVIPATGTKADREHLVPLSGEVVEILKAMPRMGDYVFTLTGETPISGFSKAKTRLDRYLASMDQELKPWRYHDLRRTCATHMVRLGVSETVVGRVLNHAAQGVTAQVYARYDHAKEKRAAMEVWAAEVLSSEG